MNGKNECCETVKKNLKLSSEKDDAFSGIGTLVQKLRQWFDFHGIDFMEKISELEDKPDRQAGDDFQLQN